MMSSEANSGRGGALIPRPVAGIAFSAPEGPARRVLALLPDQRTVELSEAAADLLRLVDGRRTVVELAVLHAAGRERAPDAAGVERLLRETFAPAGLVRFGTEPPATTPPAPRSRLWLRVPLLPARAVGAVAAGLAPLFAPPVLGALLGLSFLGQLLMVSRGLGRVLPEPWDDPQGWGPAALILLLSAVVHEFGHAAALRYGGERCGGMGIGMYRFFPVLWTDASRAWLLPPRSRLRVDLGGVLFQLLFVLVLGVADRLVPSPHWVRAALLINLSVLANLNPFLRMDGYWALGDWLGERDLRRRGRTALAELVRGRSGSRRALRVYAGLSLVYFAALGAWILMVLVPRMLDRSRDALRALAEGSADAGDGLRLFLAAVVLVGAGTFLAAGFRSLRELCGPGETAGDA
jgi:putative peptide zinc metalloprotease protein